MKTNNIFYKVRDLAKKVLPFYLFTLLPLFTACQDRDLPGSGEMQVASPDVTTINGTPSGDNNYDYTITWPQSSQGATMPRCRWLSIRTALRCRVSHHAPPVRSH